MDDTNIAVEAGGVGNGTAGVNPTGNVLGNDTDVDAGDTKAVSALVAGAQNSASGGVGANVAGSFGTITMLADGSYSYAVDNSHSAVQALRLSSQSLTDYFTYQVSDSAGLTSLATLTITIQGANDGPTATDDVATAVEAGGLGNGTTGTNPSGNLLANDTDVDSTANGETKTVIGVVAGAQASAAGNVATGVVGVYGSITVGADGAYTYTVDNTNPAVQALRTSGQTLSDVFTYTMQDASGAASTATVTVTIQGTNDTPTAVVDTSIAVEAAALATAPQVSAPAATS